MFGFTRQEQHIVLFLIFSLLVGSGVKLFRSSRVPDVSTNAAVVSEFNSISEQLNAITPESDDAEKIASRKAPEETEEEPSNQHTQVETPEPISVNINTATDKEFRKVPRIGPVLAKRIVEYRDANGLFTNVDDLLAVKGIGTKTLASIEKYLTVK